MATCFSICMYIAYVRILNLSPRDEKHCCILLAIFTRHVLYLYHAEIGLSKLPEDSLDMTKVGNHL